MAVSRRRAYTNISDAIAELPSGKVPTTLVLLLISRLMRSIRLFVPFRSSALAPRA